MRFLLCALLLAGRLYPMSDPAVYYVAPEGNDTEAGSADAPYRTLAQAIAGAAPGDTIIVRDGTYGHGDAVTGGDSANWAASPVVMSASGTPVAWITIRAEHKWRAILDCEMICDSYIDLKSSSYVVIEGLVITRGYKEGIHSNDAAHHITLRGNRFEYIANRPSSSAFGLDGLYTSRNCHDFLIEGNVFHDIGRPDQYRLDHALYLQGFNFTVVNNIFYNINHGWAIQAGDLSNVLIANNTFAFPNPQETGHIALWKTQSSITIRNNLFYSPSRYAIYRYASSVSDCSIDHNLVYGAFGVIDDPSGCTVGANTLGINPRMVNVTSQPYDFHLQTGSPAVDAGVNLSSVNFDFEGRFRPNGTAADIGAYEFVKGLPTASLLTSAVAGISGVYVSDVTPYSVVIHWTTVIPTDSLVLYGSGSDVAASAPDLAMVTQHSVMIWNLTPSTAYRFLIASTNSVGVVSLSGDSVFATAPAVAGVNGAPTAPTDGSAEIEKAATSAI